MEIDPVKWITDVEQAVVRNGRTIAQLHAQLSSVQAEVREAKVDSKERSDERLEAIMARFDQAEKLGGRRLGVGASFLVTVCTAIWFVVVQPMQEQIALLDRRLLDAERTIAVLHADSDGV